MEDVTWIKFYRKFIDWEWYQDGNTMRVFLHLVLLANWDDKKWRGVDVKRGQVIIGRVKLAEELNMSEQNVRTALKHLELTNEITRGKVDGFPIITLNNYNKYQETNQTLTNILTNDQPETNQTLTTTKEIKEIKEYIIHEKKSDKLEKKKYLDYVFLLEEEYQKLLDKFGKEKLDWCIQKLDNFIPNSPVGRKYKDHYRVLLGWVSESYDQKNPKTTSESDFYKKIYNNNK